MAIVRSQNAPKGGPEVIGKALRDLSLTRNESGALGGRNANNVNFSQPFPVYRLDLRKFKTSNDIAKAELFGWRYIFETSDDHHLGFADVRVLDGNTRFISLSESAIANRLMKAAHLAEDFAKNSKASYEARILEIPQIYISAIWLAGPEHTFFPYVDRTLLSDSYASVQMRSADYLLSIARSTT